LFERVNQYVVEVVMPKAAKAAGHALDLPDRAQDLRERYDDALVRNNPLVVFVHIIPFFDKDDPFNDETWCGE
jgi:hypothetical protein